MTFIIKAKDAQGSILAQASSKNGDMLELEGNWYFSPQNVAMEHLVVTDRIYTCPYKGVCYWIDLNMPDVKARNIGWVYRNPKEGYENIKERIAFYVRETSGTLSEQ